MKRGSIDLARQLCYEIAGPCYDEDDDMSGSGYGSIDIAEILSAEVERLRLVISNGDSMKNLLEPRIHSYITDGLPEEHPLAHKRVECGHCGKTVHAINNECMAPWVETGVTEYCLRCFADIDQLYEITDEYGLTS